jgi:predicted tellurium resistance membrane protein TerC
MLELFSLENLIALGTLTALEIVLGIDNIVFMSILVGKLREEDRGWVRRAGLGLALAMRIVLLLAISWIMRLTTPLFSLIGHEVSGRDLILLAGGLFLIAKSTYEIHDKLEGDEHGEGALEPPSRKASSVLIQIALLDLVFSLDSVITAVGMARHISIMVTAVVIAMMVMMVFAQSVGDFVERHPTMKILALSFLILIGVLLLAEGLGKHMNRGYVYFAMAFSFVVEMMNIRVRKASAVKLHQTYVDA